MIMRAEDKLEEAKYFLDILKEISPTISAESHWEENRDVHAIEPKFKHNFSACIQALRSVFDILLYDYAEKFKFIESREDYMDEKRFRIIAKACGFSESKRFIKWYRKKFKKLKMRARARKKEHLFFVRIATVHRGGSWMDTKLKDTYTMTKEGIKTEKEIYIGGTPETVAVSECERIYSLMDDIVKEARGEFP